MKKLSFVLLMFISATVLAQSGERVITTAVPFLTIAADARSSAMGDIGVASSTDVFAQQWNQSKYAFAERKSGIGISYTPYLESIITDIALLSADSFKIAVAARPVGALEGVLSPSPISSDPPLLFPSNPDAKMRRVPATKTKIFFMVNLMGFLLIISRPD